MDTLILKSPLATVQLIPIFNYLNLVSDFLFNEHKLETYNQYKQIPIVNALYEYLKDHHDNKNMQLKLIQNLLKGSDLYGEEDNENFDEIFVNTMFDYIISSLVFDKYGNIYGFLADTIRKVENLQLDYVLKVIKETLKNATFDNEYGPNSVLTELAVNRIYTDIILPIFLQPQTNLSILSLDYIFAQAGSTYLRLGTINNSYYSNDKSNKFRYSHENLFDEYLIIGNVIWNLLQDKKIDSLSLRVFALPALLYYTTTEDKLKNESITNIIFNPHHWETAFDNFQKYIAVVFHQIEDRLESDYTYKIHLGFINFQSLAAIAKSVIDSNCKFLSENQKEVKFFAFIQRAEQIECNNAFLHDKINDLYNDQIHSLGEIYGNHDLGITKQCFDESLIGDLHDIVIKLIVNNTKLNISLNNLQYLSYDLFQFYYTNNKTSDYYALIRKDYTVTLIKEADNPELFHQQMGPSFDDLIRLGERIILKFNNEGTNELCEELIKYKKERFKSYLTFFNNSLENNEWWKEFGLSLVPFYPHLSKTYNDYINDKILFEINNFKFFNQFSEDKTSHIIDLNTQSLLSVFGTTLNRKFMYDVIIKSINSSLLSINASGLSTHIETDISNFYKLASLQIEEPKFETISITKESFDLLVLIVHELREKLEYNFKSINYILSRILLLKSILFRDIGRDGKYRDQKLFVNALNYNTGYGYKFLNIYDTVTAILRTDFDIKEKIFVRVVQDFPENRKQYIKLNNGSFEVEFNYYLFEINNQLRRNNTILRFSRIWNHYDNKECMDYEYLESTKHSKYCLRHWRFMEKNRLTEEAIDKLKNNIIIDGGLVATEEQIRSKLKEFNFPDDNIFLFYFVTEWIKNKKFENSDWSRSCMVENPDLLNKLRYDLLLENNTVTIPDGISRINSIYTYRERYKIEESLSIENIIKDFTNQKAGFSVTFEDYYALRNFLESGYRRITGDTYEAKQMKLALYKLAIRQSDDLREEFEWQLFRVESKPIGIVNKEIFVGNCVIFQKFTLTSTSEVSATRYAAFAANGFRNILYEIKFNDLYFRAVFETKVDQFMPEYEKKVILLPGSEFYIKKITIQAIEGMGPVLKVLLTFKHDNIGKQQRYKYIMREITKLKL